MLSVEDKIYIKIENHWFDLTNYDKHPGGKDILKKFHLKDATNDFNLIKGHNDGYVDLLLEEFEIKNQLLLVYLNLIIRK